MSFLVLLYRKEFQINMEYMSKGTCISKRFLGCNEMHGNAKGCTGMDRGARSAQGCEGCTGVHWVHRKDWGARARDAWGPQGC